MAQKLRAELDLDTTKAEKSTRRAEQALKAFGAETQSVKGKTREMGDEVNKNAQSVDKAGAAWEGFGVKAAGAVGALITGIITATNKLAELETQRRKTFQTMADEATSPEAREFQRIMGMSATQAERYKRENAARFNVDRGQIQNFSGMLRSGISAQDVGGIGGLQQIETFGMQTMQATGTSGAGVAGLMIQAKESGSAQTPEDYKKFLGTSATMARESKVKLEEFAMIMTRTLVKARAAGIPADRWQAIAAAVTFRSPNAEQAATTLEQMLIAAGKGENVPQAIQRKGTEAIMKYQASEVARVLQDEGVVAANLYGKGIGMEGEAGQRVAAAFDVAAQAKVDTLVSKISGPGGGFRGAVLQPISTQSRDKFYQDARSRRVAEMEKFNRENKLGDFNALVAEAEAAQAQRLAEGDSAELLAEASSALMPLEMGGSSSSRNVRSEVIENMKRDLSALAGDPSVSEATRARARAALDDLGGAFGGAQNYVSFGVGGENARAAAATLLSEARRERQVRAETLGPMGRPRTATAQPASPSGAVAPAGITATNVFINTPGENATAPSKAQSAGAQ